MRRLQPRQGGFRTATRGDSAGLHLRLGRLPRRRRHVSRWCQGEERDVATSRPCLRHPRVASPCTWDLPCAAPPKGWSFRIRPEESAAKSPRAMRPCQLQTRYEDVLLTSGPASLLAPSPCCWASQRDGGLFFFSLMRFDWQVVLSRRSPRSQSPAAPSFGARDFRVGRD